MDYTIEEGGTQLQNNNFGTLVPFIREKIRRVLHKTRPK